VRLDLVEAEQIFEEHRESVGAHGSRLIDCSTLLGPLEALTY
jgi:hypothetical protein